MALTEGERRFTWTHAAKWAHGPWVTTLPTAEELAADSAAVAYADWYVATHAAVSMDYLPPHPSAHCHFLAEIARLRV